MTRRDGYWLAALGAAFLCGLVIGCPARVALRLVPGSTAAQLEAVEGSIWRGRARHPVAGAAPLELTWSLAPASLLRFAPRFALVANHPFGEFRGDVVLHGATVELLGGTLRTSLSPVARAAGLPPGTLLGAVEVGGIAASVGAGGVEQLSCAGLVSGVSGNGGGSSLALGDLAIACSTDAGGPVVAIDDRGGPLALSARVVLAPGWRYLVEGTAGARPGAPAGLAEVLPLLGRSTGPDQVRFRYAGELRR